MYRVCLVKYVLSPCLITGVKYQTITSSSTVNVGNIAYTGQYVTEEQLKERDKREYREELQQDIMATMMQQQQG